MVSDGVPAISGPVRLRRFDASDIENILELDSDPEVHRYLFRQPPTRNTVQNERLPDIIAPYEQYPGFGQRAAELGGSGQFIGWFSLAVSTPAELRQPELGYRLRPEHWGQGWPARSVRSWSTGLSPSWAWKQFGPRPWPSTWPPAES